MQPNFNGDCIYIIMYHYIYNYIYIAYKYLFSIESDHMDHWDLQENWDANNRLGDQWAATSQGAVPSTADSWNRLRDKEGFLRSGCWELDGGSQTPNMFGRCFPYMGVPKMGDPPSHHGLLKWSNDLDDFGGTPMT